MANAHGGSGWWRLLPGPVRDWLGARFGDVDGREGWGYAVWFAMGVVVAVPEIWAAVDNTAPWPTISGTVGHLEWKWSPTSIVVVGIIVFSAFHALRDPGRVGELAVQADQSEVGRTDGGRFTRSVGAGQQFSPYLYFPVALVVVIAGSLVAATLDGDKWHLAYVLYGLIALFWIVIPSVAAYLFSRDVPFPTLFRTIISLERRVHLAAVVIGTGLAVLLLHLAFYPWPDISHVLQPTPPTTHSK